MTTTTVEANIEITRKNEVLSSVSVIMPTWTREDCDGFLSVNIPLFGLRTFAKNEEDADVAISEAIKCFCISAEKFGQGLEKELQTIGWKYANKEDDPYHSLLNYNPSDNAVLEQMMETGDQYAHNDLQIA